MGISLAVLCAICYSSNYILIQLGMRKSPKDNGDYLSLFACVVTVLVIYLGYWLFFAAEIVAVSGKGILFFLLAGFLTAFVGRILLFQSIRSIGSSRAAGIKNSAPVFTILVAVIWMGERISAGAGIGILIIFAALFLQARHDFKAAGQLSGKVAQRGLLIAVISAVFFGLGQASRKVGVMYYADPILGSLIGSSFALAVFTIRELFSRRLKETWKRNFQNINPYFVGAGILTGIAQISFFLSILYTHVSYTSAVAAMEPIITVILSKFFLKKEENVTLRIGFTACAVFLGTFILIWMM